MWILYIELSQKSCFQCVPETWRDDLRLALEVRVPFPEVLVSNLHGQ